MIDVQLLKSEVLMNEKCDKQKVKLGSGFFIRHATTPSLHGLAETPKRAGSGQRCTQGGRGRRGGRRGAPHVLPQKTLKKL